MAHWLKARGLTLSVEKTQIVHLCEGFDFLGFHIRRSPAPQTSPTGYRLRVTPSKHATQEIRKKLRLLWRQSLGSEVGAVLNMLNPRIRGWANYFRVVAAGNTFHKLDTWMFHRALHYTKRTHPRKPWYWRKIRYWGRLNRTRKDTWVFGDKRLGAYLLKFAWFRRTHHALVKGRASPDDPTLREYWERREKAKVRLLPPNLQKLAGRQQGRCLGCGASLFTDEELHVHHREPRHQGGKNCYDNLAFVHLYCHQQFHCRQIRKAAAGKEYLH